MAPPHQARGTPAPSTAPCTKHSTPSTKYQAPAPQCPYNSSMKSKIRTFSRRGLLKKGAAAAAGSAALATQADSLFAQSNAPAVVTRRRFRGWISRGTGPGRTTLQELTLRPISGRQVLVRTEATNLCYSNTGVVLGLPQNFGPPPAAPAGAGAGPAAPAPHLFRPPFAG